MLGDSGDVGRVSASNKDGARPGMVSYAGVSVTLPGESLCSLGKASLDCLCLTVCTVRPGCEIPGGAHRWGAAVGNAGLQRQGDQMEQLLGTVCADMAGEDCSPTAAGASLPG